MGVQEIAMIVRKETRSRFMVPMLKDGLDVDQRMRAQIRYARHHSEGCLHNTLLPIYQVARLGNRIQQTPLEYFSEVVSGALYDECPAGF